jgi:hypothetical protein
MRQFIFGALLALGTAASFTSAQSQLAFNEKSPRIQLVSEFVREVEVLYRLQETAQKELAEDDSASGKIRTSIRVGTRTVFEMDDSIRRLDRIAVDGEWADTKNLLKRLDAERIRIAQEVIEMSKTMLSGPQPGVNYGAITAHLPELTAQMEQADKSVLAVLF